MLLQIREAFRNFSVFYLVKAQGRRERSSPLSKIVRSSLPNLGKSQRSAQSRCAMDKPHPEGTTLLIMVSSAPGKYAVKKT